jgi:hypothetical protein
MFYASIFCFIPLFLHSLYLFIVQYLIVYKVFLILQQVILICSVIESLWIFIFNFFALQNFVLNFYLIVGSGMLSKAFEENSHEKLWDVLWKRLQWMAFQPGRCKKLCNPDGTKGTPIMHGGYLISESYDTVGEY